MSTQQQCLYTSSNKVDNLTMTGDSKFMKSCQTRALSSRLSILSPWGMTIIQRLFYKLIGM